MQALFEPLRERLQAGGVRRGPARRYVAELKDHLDDLIAEERRAMSDPREAEIRALSRLGSLDMLAEAMIERGEFQTWSRKAPFAAFLVAPVAAMAAGTLLAAVAVVMTVKGVRGAEGAAAQLPAWLAQLAGGAVFFSHAVLPVLLAWALGIVAFRNRAPLLWPICGILVLAVLGSTVHLDLTLPSPTTHGEVSISGELRDTAAQITAFAAQLALAALPYAALLFWRAARERRTA